MRHIITIVREFGSGGFRTNYKLPTTIRKSSQKLQSAPLCQRHMCANLKRPAPSWSTPSMSATAFYSMPPPSFQQDILIFIEQHRLLEELSGRSDCIIDGRCADYILRDRHPFRIFVYADTASKLQRCMERRSTYEMLTDTQMQ